MNENGVCVCDTGFEIVGIEAEGNTWCIPDAQARTVETKVTALENKLNLCGCLTTKFALFFWWAWNF